MFFLNLVDLRPLTLQLTPLKEPASSNSTATLSEWYHIQKAANTVYLPCNGCKSNSPTPRTQLFGKARFTNHLYHLYSTLPPRSLFCLFGVWKTRFPKTAETNISNRTFSSLRKCPYENSMQIQL